MAEHKERIYELLQKADYYEGDGESDGKIAQAIGMKALLISSMPAAG